MSASSPAPTPSSGCGRNSIHGYARDRYERDKNLSAPRQDRSRRDRIPPDVAGPTRPPCSTSRKNCRRMICCSCRATSASQRCCRPGSRRSSAAPITSLLAVKAGRVVGCGTLVRDPQSWSPHVGEIRNVVSLDVRGQGVGRALSQETFALALGRRSGKARGADDGRSAGAIAIFEGLGFKAEALLRDHVKDKDGKNPRYRGARAQCGAGPGPVGSLRASRGRPALIAAVPSAAFRGQIRSIFQPITNS